MRLRAAVIGLLGLMPGPPGAAAASTAWWSGEAAWRYDDNVANARDGTPSADDQAWSALLLRQVAWDAGTHSAWTLGGRLEGERFREVQGLSSAAAALGLRWDRRSSAAFGAPRWSLGAQLGWREFDSRLRDGADYQLRAAVQQQLNTRFKASAAALLQRRDAHDRVFDLTSASVGADLDWRLRDPLTLYLGYQFRYGDFVTTGFPSEQARADAEAVALDDAFDADAQGPYALRLEGRTQLWRGGVNLGLSRHWALDLQLQQARVRSEADVRYRRKLYFASLLFRF